MTPDKTRKQLALMAGDELSGRGRRKLEARLGREPELAAELEDLREVRRLYADLGQAEIPSTINRDHLRTRVLARVREEARRQPARRWSWRPFAAAGALASCILGVGLAIILIKDPGPADKRSEGPVPASMELQVEKRNPGLDVLRYEVKMTLADGPTGPVLRWTNGDEDARFVVLRSTRPGQAERLAVVRGHEWADPEPPDSALLQYRVVRLPERT